MLLYKIIVLGAAGAGKTAFMNNYLGQPFHDTDGPTIGVEFGTKLLNVNDDRLEDRIKLTIWNTSGQERFHSIVASYYRNIQGVIFVCDLTSLDSFQQLYRWINDFKNQCTSDFDNEISKVIVGTKADLVDERMVSDEDLVRISEETGIKYFVTSSKTDSESIKDVFEYLADDAIDKFIIKPNGDMLRKDIVQIKGGVDSGYSRYFGWCNVL